MNMDAVQNQMRDFNMLVINNNVDRMRVMIETYRYNVNNVGLNGITALHKAARYSSPDTLKFLLSKVVTANTLNDKGESPLMFAAERGRCS